MKKIRTLLVTLSFLLIFSVVAPSFSLAAESKSNEIVGTEDDVIKNINADDIDYLEIKRDMVSNLGDKGNILEQPQTQGVKSKAAKVAAKAMLKKLHHIGSKSWDAAVNKIPLLPNAAKKFLRYQFVAKVLNAVTGFEGTITNAISDYMTNTLHVNRTVSNIVARTAVTILL